MPKPEPGEDALDHGRIFNQRDDAHLRAAFRADEPSDLVDLANQLRPGGFRGLADRVGPVWGIDEEEQELRNMWKPTGQPGLWFIAGSFAQCRIYSKYLGLQIKAHELGLIRPHSPRIGVDKDAAVATTPDPLGPK